MTDIIVRNMLIIYYLLCFLYLLYALFNFKKRRFLLYFIIMAFIPFAGVVLVFLSCALTKDKSKELEFFEQFEKPKIDVAIRDKQAELNATSVLDVLMINDVKTKREVVFDIFRSDCEKYVKELKIALNDSDTEVAHYASSALTEIKRNFDNTVVELGAQYKKDSQNIDALLQYTKTLLRYINSNIMDKSTRKKYMNTYCAVMQGYYKQVYEVMGSAYEKNIIERGDDYDSNDRQFFDMSDYKYYLNFLYKTGKAQQAVDECKQMLEVFVDKAVYFSALELFYKMNMQKEFFDTIDIIKSSPVVLTKQEIDTLRFFLKRAVKKQ